ncbi:Rrf2 family transcriptional regulator [Aurantimonas sp. HBX-1]|uniref:RrF2 family transcriptional regulator n=1 Tax=Aurantimonas sp. HBX-1 TaxID=2906072 RepID=UPI001F1BDA8A|nr:Rrf2 family transcriptional regulator [Aurantimonas sp. HBX-1]UIJ73003.1 Rrf2 family transcriptional regulator [Aurantimonas sp. HBX-1]
MSDTRLARMLHVLAHMHLLGGTETSETIALMLDTNPVVVRRTMGILKHHGLVTSTGGRSGGWRLAKPAQEITVRQVHDALSTGSSFAFSLSNDHPACPVEGSANHILRQAMEKAEATLRAELDDVSIDDIASAASAKR